MWTARRILKELADTDLRRKVLTAFWKHADAQAKALANAHISKAMHFRDETIRKMPAEKKADLLASRIGAPDFDQFLEIGLMQYHTNGKGEMLGAFLDKWDIPHVDGSIEVDEYRTPTIDQVREAAQQLQQKFPLQEIRLYLASAGLLMGEEWAAATWPVVDELTQPAS